MGKLFVIEAKRPRGVPPFSLANRSMRVSLRKAKEAAGGQMKGKLFEVRSDEPGRGIEWSHEGDLSVNERGLVTRD